MALRKRLIRKAAEPVQEEQPRARFTRNVKPPAKVEPEVEESDEVEEQEPEVEIPEIFDTKPEEKPQQVVKKVVVPPPPTKGKPVLYHKQQELPITDSDDVPTNRPVEVTYPAEVNQIPLEIQSPAVGPGPIDNATLISLLTRIISVQEDLTAIIKSLMQPASPALTVYSGAAPQPAELPAAPKAKTGKAASAPVEKPQANIDWEKRWKKLSFEEKVAEAKAAGVVWAPHDSQARENINLTIAYKKHFGLK